MVSIFDSQAKIFLGLIAVIIIILLLERWFYKAGLNAWGIFGLFFLVGGFVVIILNFQNIFGVIAATLYFLIAVLIFYAIHKRKI